jgi:hypothetical protein
VIWLHGDAGDTPQGWAAACQRLQSPWVKFLFPAAPRGGWFEREGGSEGSEDEVRAAASVVLDLVALESEVPLQPLFRV